MSDLLRTENYISVSQFFDGRSVFVTGGTGFVGKMLIEKLLWSCPGIKNIYLLIRPKKGRDVTTRLSELLEEPVFERLRRAKPTELRKIRPIEGDILKPELGLSESDRELLARTASVIFHSAASIKFEEPLKDSIASNVLGVKHLMELCHRMRELQVLVHASTAYCNCDREEINEVVYPPPYDPEKIIQCTSWMDDDLLGHITPKFTKERPNTYTFTKALAENVLLKERGRIPMVIVRPSIILSSLNEPAPGWIDNWNGPTKLVAALGKGFIHTMHGHGNMTADFVPVDIVANLMICSAWHVVINRPVKDIIVFNCTSGERNPVSWKEFVGQCITYLRETPFDDVRRSSVFFSFKSNSTINYYTRAVLHYLPAFFMDVLRVCTCKHSKMVRLQSKLLSATQCLEYFTTHQWRFMDENVRQLHTSLSEEDRQMYVFDVREIHWPTYLQSYIIGIRNFLFKKNSKVSA